MKFDDSTVIHYQYSVAVHNCVQSMGYRKYRAIVEFSSYGSLDEPIRGGIDVGRSLVENEYLIFSEDGSSEAKQLPFSSAEIGATLVDRTIQRRRWATWALRLEELDILESRVQRGVVVTIERIEIVAQRRGKENGLLWYYRNFAAQIVETDLSRVYSVYVNVSLDFSQVEERRYERRFSSSGSTDDTDFHSRLDRNINVFENGRRLGLAGLAGLAAGVTQINALKFDRSFLGPRRRWFVSRLALERTLLLELREFQYSFDTRHLCDHFGRLSHSVLHHSAQNENLRDGQADVSSESCS